MRHVVGSSPYLLELVAARAAEVGAVRGRDARRERGERVADEEHDGRRGALGARERDRPEPQQHLEMTCLIRMYHP